MSSVPFRRSLVSFLVTAPVEPSTRTRTRTRAPEPPQWREDSRSGTMENSSESSCGMSNSDFRTLFLCQARSYESAPAVAPRASTRFQAQFAVQQLAARAVRAHVLKGTNDVAHTGFLSHVPRSSQRAVFAVFRAVLHSLTTLRSSVLGSELAPLVFDDPHWFFGSKNGSHDPAAYYARAQSTGAVPRLSGDAGGVYGKCRQQNWSHGSLFEVSGDRSGRLRDGPLALAVTMERASDFWAPGRAQPPVRLGCR